MEVIIYPYPNVNKTLLLKGAPDKTVPSNNS